MIQSEQAIAQEKDQPGQKQIGVELQSPIDLSDHTQSLPLSADSMDMDVQYFRNEDNTQGENSTADSISTFVGTKVSTLLDDSFSARVGASTHQAVSPTYNVTTSSGRWSSVRTAPAATRRCSRRS